MPGRRPRRGNSKKPASTRNTESQPPPSPSEDAKPNVDQLNANLEAEAGAQADGGQDHVDVQREPEGTPEPVESSVPHGLPIVQDFEEAAISTPLAAPPAPRGRGRGQGSGPRGKRRSEAERRELVRAAEEQKKADAVTSTPAQQSGRGRGRGDGNRRGGWGRGAFMGQAERSEQEPVAVSGPFSSGLVHKESRHIKRAPPSSGWTGMSANAVAESSERPSTRRSWSHMGQRTSGSGGTTGKTNAGSGRDVKPVLDQDGDIQMDPVDGGYISSDEGDAEDGIERVDINDFGVVDLTHDDDDDDRGFFNPVRVRRVKHKERTLGINAEGATNQEGDIAVDANDVAAVVEAKTSKRTKQSVPSTVAASQQKQSFQAVYSDSDDNLAQNEPLVKVESEPIEVDSASANEQPPSSPESKRKGKERLRAVRATSPALAVPGSEYHTQEDIEEWERQQEDLRIIRAELGDVATNGENNVATLNGQANPDKRADKVYLFQFPPVLPDLLSENTSNGTNGNTSDPMHLDPTVDQPIKLEPSTSNDEAKHHTASPFPSGAVGKLNVHASGKVTLDWGGTAMTLGLGTEATFLQDLMLTTLPDKKVGMEVDGSSGGVKGEAVGFGRVRGKFVVVPDWEGVLE